MAQLVGYLPSTQKVVGLSPACTLPAWGNSSFSLGKKKLSCFALSPWLIVHVHTYATWVSSHRSVTLNKCSGNMVVTLVSLATPYEHILLGWEKASEGSTDPPHPSLPCPYIHCVCTFQPPQSVRYMYINQWAEPPPTCTCTCITPTSLHAPAPQCHSSLQLPFTCHMHGTSRDIVACTSIMQLTCEALVVGMATTMSLVYSLFADRLIQKSALCTYMHE